MPRVGHVFRRNFHFEKQHKECLDMARIHSRFWLCSGICWSWTTAALEEHASKSLRHCTAPWSFFSHVCQLRGSSGRTSISHRTQERQRVCYDLVTASMSFGSLSTSLARKFSTQSFVCDWHWELDSSVAGVLLLLISYYCTSEHPRIYPKRSKIQHIQWSHSGIHFISSHRPASHTSHTHFTHTRHDHV